MRSVDILIISLSNPILIGIYENEKLIESFSEKAKSSDIIPILFSKILKKYRVKSIFYTNGPGSYMSTKVIYLFIVTLSKIYNIKLGATLGFEFNNFSPIKALGKKYFIYKNGEIVLEKYSEELTDFRLPQLLDRDIFEESVEPKYMLNAVD